VLLALFDLELFELLALGHKNEGDRYDEGEGLRKISAAWSAVKRMQRADGGWGSTDGSSTEETALALETIGAAPSPPPELWPPPAINQPSKRALQWLADRVLSGAFTEPAPIGFYFAKLWYYEKMYPIIWTVGALRRAREFERRQGAPLL